MANNVNIFDKYGIKEVANVYFEALEDDVKAGVYKGDIVLFLDTLKVSTIETTAENTAAQGGWGNPQLVQWDYGKEINITLEDALMSLESLRFMLGGAIKKDATQQDPIIVRHTEEVVCDSNGKVPLPKDHLTGVTMHPIAKYNHPIRLINLTKGTRTQIVVENSTDTQKVFDGNKVIAFVNPALIGDTAQDSEAGDHIRIFWDEVLESNEGNETAVEVTISPDTFPGTYKVVGDTFMRSEKTGKDEPFQFIINKAKVQSNVTLTLQAEGDPTTFEMTLNVLRSTNEDGQNEMMKLVRYNIATSTTSGTADDHTTTSFSGSVG
jgi:hypothetical protein